MKRNYGIIIAAFFALLKTIGINTEITQADIDTIGMAIGGILAAIGTAHDIYRRIKTKKIGIDKK